MFNYKLVNFLPFILSSIVVTRLLAHGLETEINILVFGFICFVFLLVTGGIISYKSKFLFRFILIKLLITVPLVSFVKLQLAEQGTDFALFCQLISNISEGIGLSSWIIQKTEMNYLRHHFSPFLYFLGLIKPQFLPVEYFLIFLTVVSIIVSFIFLQKIFETYGNSKLISSFLLCYLFLTPAIRINFYHDFREEILALPFFVLALYFKDKTLIASILAGTLPAFIKESLAPLSGILVFVSGAKVRFRACKITTCIFGVILFLEPIIYAYIQERFLNHPSFLNLRIPNSIDLLLIQQKIFLLAKVSLVLSLGIPLIFISWQKLSQLKYVLGVLILVAFGPAFITNHPYLSLAHSYYMILFYVFWVMLVALCMANWRVSDTVKLLSISLLCLISANIAPKENLLNYVVEYFRESINPKKAVLQAFEKCEKTLPEHRRSVLGSEHNKHSKLIVLATARSLSLICGRQALTRLSFFQHDPSKAFLIVVDKRDLGYPDERRLSRWLDKISKTHKEYLSIRNTIIFINKNCSN
ncbi:MAG: DUF2079 domain-containing protein [Deltaproteobacteria bacterium]|nr:DUF2079 domain-containing protein [Deltaproteobacteria bacterium]